MFRFERPNKIMVQNGILLLKINGNTLALETAEDLNITELRNVNEILDECEPGETIELINRSEIILDGCQSCENISEGVSK